MKMFFAFFLSLLFLNFPAHAISVDFKGIAAVKVFDPMPDAEKEKLKKHKEIKPYNEETLSYELLLPADWTDNIQKSTVDGGIGGSSLSNSVPELLGKYISSPKNLVRSFLTVEAQNLTYEISARNWTMNFILTNGFTLAALTEKSPHEIEATYIEFERDQSYSVRVRALINGSKIVLVRYYLPQENEKDEEALQAQTISSFHFLKEQQGGIEKLEAYGFLDQSYFNYPTSWVLKDKNILSIERMYALLFQSTRDLDNNVKLNGHIKVEAISRLLNTTMAQEIETFRDNLSIPNYAVGDLIETLSYKFDASISSGKTQVYDLVPDDPVNLRHYEFLVAVMEGRDYFYIVSMVSPKREDDFFVWAQNIEAVRIVAESVRRDNLSTEIDPNDPYYDYLKQ